MAGEPIDNHALLAALKHPLRRDILRAMGNKKAVSPRELADQLDESLSNVSYHVRVLAERGVIEHVKERQVRGATQHFYRWALRARWALTVLRGPEGRPPKKKP